MWRSGVRSPRDTTVIPPLSLSLITSGIHISQYVCIGDSLFPNISLHIVRSLVFLVTLTQQHQQSDEDEGEPVTSHLRSPGLWMIHVLLCNGRLCHLAASCRATGGAAAWMCRMCWWFSTLHTEPRVPGLSRAPEWWPPPPPPPLTHSVGWSPLCFNALGIDSQGEQCESCELQLLKSLRRVTNQILLRAPNRLVPALLRVLCI